MVNFTREYLGTALWSSTDDDGEPLDDNYNADDFSDEAIKRAAADCAAFLARFEGDIGGSESQAAHDLWLTRCHHGAGFWDGDWPEPLATRMTDYAHKIGEQWVYVGDDGMLYIG